MPHPPVIHRLEGVLAFEASIALLDGPNGVLSYRGSALHQFAESASFEDTAFLILEGRWPNAPESNAFAAELASLRSLPDPVEAALRLLPLHACNPVAALRTAISV